MHPLIPLLSTVLLLVLLQLVVDCMAGKKDKKKVPKTKKEESSESYLKILEQCERMWTKNQFGSVRRLLENNKDFVNGYRLKLVSIERFNDFHDAVSKAVSDHLTDKALGDKGTPNIKQLESKEKILNKLHNGGLYILLMSKRICKEIEAQNENFVEKDKPKAEGICADLPAQIDTFIRQNILPGHVVDTENIHGVIIKLIEQYSSRIIERIKEAFPEDHENKEKENSNLFVEQIIKLIENYSREHEDKANISGMIIYLIKEHFSGDQKQKEKKESRSIIASQMITLIKENFASQENSAKSHGSPGRSPDRSTGRAGRLGHIVKGITFGPGASLSLMGHQLVR